MSVFTVRHATVYRYSEPVGLGEHRWMFQPRASHDLRLIKSSLAITPQPADLHWTHDVFDNSVAVATFTGQTTELRFESIVTLEHIESGTPEYRLEPAARTYPFAYSSEERASSKARKTRAGEGGGRENRGKTEAGEKNRMLRQMLNGAEEVRQQFGNVRDDGFDQGAIFAGVDGIEIGDCVVD